MSDDLACMASWIAWGIARGFLTPAEVHYGLPPKARPSKRMLTMSPPLVDALAQVKP